MKEFLNQLKNELPDWQVEIKKGCCGTYSVKVSNDDKPIYSGVVSRRLMKNPTTAVLIAEIARKALWKH